MKIEGHIDYNKALIVDEKTIKGITNSISNYCDNIKFIATTIRDSRIEFENIDELLGFENFGLNKIKKIKIVGYKNNTRNITLEIGTGIDIIFTVWCSYEFDCLDDEKKFRDEIINSLEKSKTSYLYIIRLVKLIDFTALILLSIFFLIFLLSFLKITNFNLPDKFLNLILILTIIYFLLSNMYEKFIKKLLPIVSFSIGEGIKEQEKSAKYRHNILWTVIIGALMTIVLGIVVSFIYDNIK